MASEDPALLQHWVHSHEEDRGEEMVFRPASYAFPLSRGRRSLQFQPSGKLGHGGPGPDDRPTSSEGKWSLEGKSLTIAGPGGKEEYQLASVTPEKLVLRKA